MSETAEWMLVELKRLRARPVTRRAEVLSLLDDLAGLSSRLVSARDAIGKELRALQSGLAAVQAYHRMNKRKQR